MTDDTSRDFDAFMKQREKAAAAYVTGDAAPLIALSAQQGVATFFGPGGGHVTGAEEVVARYEKDVGAFEEGSETHFKIIDMGASGDVGYWTGYQHAVVRMKGKPDPIPMKLRVTEVFRREGGTWRLVHRHADGLAEEKK